MSGLVRLPISIREGDQIHPKKIAGLQKTFIPPRRLEHNYYISLYSFVGWILMNFC